MHSALRHAPRAFAVAILLTATASSPQAAPGIAGPTAGAATLAWADDAPSKCCFTNPGYSGTCEVEPAKDESCGQILGYLNNPLAQGKSYCGNTTVRSGWKQAACDKK